MNRDKKIGILIDYLIESNIKIIETKNIQGLIIDAQVDKDRLKEDLLEEENWNKLTSDDIEELVKFLEKSQYMLVDIDSVSGVSFDNCEIGEEHLYDTDLWKEGGDS